MRNLNWTAAEKKIAREAFDRAYAAESQAIRRELNSMLNQRRKTDAEVIWSMHEYLVERRREIDRKYDYRYSVLIMVFGQLCAQGWLDLDDLAGLDEDKLHGIRRILKA